MDNKITADSFENLGGVVKSASGQIKKVVKQAGDDILENVGLKPSLPGQETPGQTSDQTPPPPDQNNEAEKLKAKQIKLSRKKYQQLREEIHQMQVRRGQEMVEYSQPGLTVKEKQEKQIQQLEEKKEGKLPPLPVQRASRTTESKRGVSG